jgi:hypothetical protein
VSTVVRVLRITISSELLSVDAAVDSDGLPVDPVAGRTCQEGDNLGDVQRGVQALEGNGARESGDGRFVLAFGRDNPCPATGVYANDGSSSRSTGCPSASLWP